MGLFGRKRPDRPTSAQALRVDFAVGDLARLEDLLDDFLGSVGTSRLEVVAQRIALAGGIDVDHLERSMGRGSGWMQRPWQWLHRGAQVASSGGRGDLVIKTSGVVGFWQMAIAPHLGPADFFAMGLSSCPPDIETAIHHLALDPSIDLSEDLVLATDADGVSMTVGLVRDSARLRIESSTGAR